MLKRYQVLLEDWQEEYVKFIAQKYDLGFSEVIRGLMCVEAIEVVRQLFPKYKLKLTAKNIKEMLEKYARKDRAVLHRFMSSAYYEARKAMEYRISKEKQKRK